MSRIAEYFGPDAGHQKPKAFDIVPAQDPLTQTILQARREAVTDRDLSDGAKLLFVLLLDWSLWPGKNVKPGVVRISTTKLCELLARSARAIWGWKQELLKKQLIWIRDHFLPNAYPMHEYHIAVLDPEEHGGAPVTQDGLWGNCRRRSAWSKEQRGLGARDALRSSKQHLENGGDFHISSEIATGSRTEGHLSVAESAVGNRKFCDSQPQNLRLATAKSAIGNRSKRHLPTAANSTSQPHKTAPLIEAQIGDLSLSEGRGKASPPDKAFEAAFKAWEGRLDDMRNSDLRKVEEIAVRELQDAKSEYAKSVAKRKLAAIRLRLRGPSVPDQPVKPSARPARKASQPMPTEEELLASARNLVSLGMEKSLLPNQRAALKRAGEL
jgi:hypothetical protein